MKKKRYIQPLCRPIDLWPEHLMNVSVDKRGYAIDNENADDDKIIDVQRQTTDYFTTDFMELD